jgi:hypothetical protein
LPQVISRPILIYFYIYYYDSRGFDP